MQQAANRTNRFNHNSQNPPRTHTHTQTSECVMLFNNFHRTGFFSVVLCVEKRKYSITVDSSHQNAHSYGELKRQRARVRVRVILCCVCVCVSTSE